MNLAASPLLRARRQGRGRSSRCVSRAGRRAQVPGQTRQSNLGPKGGAVAFSSSVSRARRRRRGHDLNLATRPRVQNLRDPKPQPPGRWWRPTRHQSSRSRDGNTSRQDRGPPPWVAVPQVPRNTSLVFRPELRPRFMRSKPQPPGLGGRSFFGSESPQRLSMCRHVNRVRRRASQQSHTRWPARNNR